MRFTPTFLDEIKARLPVSEVVGRRVKLRKEGREFKGLSPFTSEKSPSFFVNDSKMAWFDFSSGQQRQHLRLRHEDRGPELPRGGRTACGRGRARLPVETRESREREEKRSTLQDVLDQAAKFFEAQLQDRGGAKARGYLGGRGLTPALQVQFRIGYAPNEKFALRDHLAGKGASVETMIEAGLLVHGDDIAVPYDRFRDRVMFPMPTDSGRIIAFGGRAMEKDVAGEIPEFAGDAALSQGFGALQPPHRRPQGRA